MYLQMAQIIADSKLKEPRNNYGKAIDIATTTDQSIFRCLLQQGFTVAFIRVYLSNGNGNPDSNCIASIYYAANERLGVEIYVEPQPLNSAKTGSGQFMEVYTFLINNNIAMRAIWIKVTTPINWPKNQVANVNFINEFIISAWRYGIAVGIYTSWYDWKQITAGQLATEQGKIRLWYWNSLGLGPNAATSPTFDDFRIFDGFKMPTVKQYAQNEYICGIYASLNVYVNEIAMKASLPLNMANVIVVGNLPYR
ncbi:unnamed protein product [Cercopithifilaria johnstoni]|uniref:Lysozyme n=1 Tax=Cercopithifilaria johnstoni TaxID=2874296 RepID=A0A8J2LU18_9BILA|nr:unnamed protein product [Cercopithifilaria johnstoni]